MVHDNIVDTTTNKHKGTELLGINNNSSSSGTEDLPHNDSQPVNKAPLDRRGVHRTKFASDCRQQHRESLVCIEENYENKDQVCQHLFDAYKACRKEERKRQKWKY